LHRPLFLASGRSIAFFIGAFSLLNILGELRFPGFDANHWWIDFRPIPAAVSRVFLTVASLFLIAWSIRPRMSARRRKVTLVLAGLLLANTVRNAAGFYILLVRPTISAGCPVAFSLLVAIALLLVLISVAATRTKSPISGSLSAKLTFAVTLLVLLVGFPLAQMFCFGMTDYRRSADAIVVFGARVYADGRCSDALADRVRTGCTLYRQGLADRLILSGGPGDANIHETEAMRTLAIQLGVPPLAILRDQAGVNTRATVKNTCDMFDNLAIDRVLVVSHFYHLPRIKMTYQRRRWEVYTVPARETYTLTKMPLYILREVLALWAYYLGM
jgi:vancomycin permeability regulator SanA